jgi:hypothetical protein
VVLGLSGKLALWDHRTLRYRIRHFGVGSVLSGISLCSVYNSTDHSIMVTDHSSDEVYRVLLATKCLGSIAYSVCVADHPV